MEGIRNKRMNGYIGELDEDQKAMLEQVRENLSDVLKEDHDDRFLLRFLKARSFHNDDSEDMVRAHLRWRKHFDVEYLTKEYQPPEIFEKHLKMSVLGFTNEGNLMRILRLGHSDLKGVVLGATSLEIETFMAYVLTLDGLLMDKNNKQANTYSESAVYIGDFQDLNPYDLPWKYTLSTVIRLVKIFEANFPEHLHSVHLINCPTVIYFILKVVKPFLSEITASKIHIYTEEGYQDVLRKCSNPEILPDFLGGSRCDTVEDKTCEYLSTKTEEIPESTYVSNARRLAATDPGITEATVERRQSLCVDVEVPEADYAIICEVDIKDYDLGLGLFVRENSDSTENLKCIRPVKRFKSHFSPHLWMHICEHPGKYVLMMDNRYSYFTDKFVLYRIKVKPPQGREM